MIGTARPANPRTATLHAVRDELAAAVGPAHVSDGELDRLAYGHDAWPVALKDPGVARWLPDLVVCPGSVEDVVAVVRAAAGAGLPVVPAGGLSGIVGGALATSGGIVVDLLRMGRVLDLDERSGLVRVEAGMIGENLEDDLRARGFTLGHYPQSSRSSTVGGWIAHRAAGVASTRYGKIESIVRGLRAVLADGRVLDIPAQPASAAGIDLTRLFLGAEGSFGIVVDATLAVHRLPPVRQWAAWAFPPRPAGQAADGPARPDLTEAGPFGDALEVVRRVLQRGYRPAIVRAYDPDEAAAWLGRAGLDEPGAALLIVGAEGEAPVVDAELAACREEAAGIGARGLGAAPGEAWLAHRFDTSGLIAGVRAPGSIGDALEVAAPWSRLGAVYAAVRAATLAACGPGGVVHVHLSHAYPDGGNLYVIFRASRPDDAAALDAYPGLVDAALGACLAAGGTTSHHHGMGLAKRHWLERELGPDGLDVVRALKRALDPAGTLNPGKLGGAP